MGKSATERSREFRARKAAAAKAEAAARAASVAVVAPGPLAAAVDEAVGAMKWLMPSDAAAVQLAKISARRIDQLVADGDPRVTSEEQALIRILGELGGTPTVRMQHELRSRRLAKDGEGADAGDEGEQQKPAVGDGNVTQFQRPAKRARR